MFRLKGILVESDKPRPSETAVFVWQCDGWSTCHLNRPNIVWTNQSEMWKNGFKGEGVYGGDTGLRPPAPGPTQNVHRVRSKKKWWAIPQGGASDQPEGERSKFRGWCSCLSTRMNSWPHFRSNSGFFVCVCTGTRRSNLSASLKICNHCTLAFNIGSLI